MISKVLYLFLVVYFLMVFKNIQANSIKSEIILCRSCGNDISSNDSIFTKHSPKSYRNFNESLFGMKDVHIEVFSTNFFLQYPVITFHYSTCEGFGEWEEDTSWYPGYHWRPCVCPQCGDYIGWVFEPIKPTTVDSSNTFYGLILDSLISENFINNLMQYPDLIN